MPIVPIDSDFNNINKFVDSLFDSDVRTIESVKNAIYTGSFMVGFSSEVYKILPVWMAVWQKAQGDPYSRIHYEHSKLEDQQTFTFLSNYIKENALVLYIPQLVLVSGQSSMPPVYQLKTYKKLSLSNNGEWNYASILNLLKLFLFGAHFVVIQHPEDLPSNIHVADFYQAFCSSPLKSSKRKDPGHSHYTSTVNTCGYYFPSVEKDTAPLEATPFNLSWLVGLSKSNLSCESSSANVFFQLEGWQALNILSVLKGRHHADYKIHEQTLWNISTYGACAYSEKRGTAIFLAPENWNPVPNKETIMPPYVGAKPLQPWLNTSVVKVA